MADPEGTRKLQAILAADVAGYSRLMQEDDATTVNTLEAYRAVFRKRIQAHHGRVVDMAGDSVLAVFEAATEAVRAAFEIQGVLGERNEALPETRRMRFRIGVNLGEVIERPDGTVYGDGVNVAARLESIVEPGGVMVSGTIYDHVERMTSVSFTYTGEHSVKNIAKPVRAYRVQFADAKPTLSTQTPPALKGRAGPSIAVLPFANLAQDVSLERLCDGLTEDTITRLSKLPDASIIARNSTLQYKGKAVDVRQVGRELGVRYVLEGSIQALHDRVRVTAQLIDASTGEHVWAERYDRAAQNAFDLQDEISRSIFTELNVTLVMGEEAASWRRGTKSDDAYELVLRGFEHHNRMTQEDLTRARRSFEKAIQLDPDYATAYTELAFNSLNMIIVGCSTDPSADLERAFQFARRGIELDPTQGMAYICLARLYMQNHDFDNALLHAKKAVQLEPNGTITLSLYAHILEASGKPGEALPQIDRTIRLGPRPEGWWHWLQALCLNQLGRHEESIAAMKRHLSISPNALFPQVFLVSLYVSAGQEQLAKAQAQEVMKIDPTFSVDAFLKGWDFYKDPSTIKGYAQNMRRAGLPG